ncbi:MAG: RAMP superfamily CRISPR-associated protein [Bacillota bacterium]
MLKKKINRVAIDLTLRAVGPLLIKEGERAKKRHDDREQGDKHNKLRFLRTHKGDGEPYIPGSSLKGVLRSQAEKIINLLNQNQPLACNPVATGDSDEYQSCSDKLEEKKKANDNQLVGKAYNYSCPICKIFGNQFTKSRIIVEDAYLTTESKARLKDDLPHRDGAPINRFVGNNNNLFQYEFIEGQNFKTSITLENFELWQLGLLAFLLRDLYTEEIKVGFGTARGMGKVKGIIEQIKFSYFNPAVKLQKGQKLSLMGIDRLDDSTQYDYVQQTELSCEVDEIITGSSFFPQAIINNSKDAFPDSDVWTVLKSAADKFSLEEIKNVQSTL